MSEIGPVGGLFVAVAIFLFAFSSIIGNYYYGEANVRFITSRRGVLTLYRLLGRGHGALRVAGDARPGVEPC